MTQRAPTLRNALAVLLLGTQIWLAKGFFVDDSFITLRVVRQWTHGNGLVYNVGCGGRTDLTTLYSLLRERATEYQSHANQLEPEYADPRPGDVPHSQADIGLIRDKLGYDPTHDVAEGLTETVRWFAKTQGIGT